MAQQTALSPLATPGKTYPSFAGKVEAVPEKGAGPFTRMLPEALPRMRYGSFAGKALFVPPPTAAVIERYVPGELPLDYDPVAVMEELRRVRIVMDILLDGYNEVRYAEPSRPREGMIVFADGAEWNPGSGAGAYEYKSGAWVKI